MWIWWGGNLHFRDKVVDWTWVRSYRQPLVRTKPSPHSSFLSEAKAPFNVLLLKTAHRGKPRIWIHFNFIGNILKWGFLCTRRDLLKSEASDQLKNKFLPFILSTFLPPSLSWSCYVAQASFQLEVPHPSFLSPRVTPEANKSPTSLWVVRGPTTLPPTRSLLY